MQTTSAISEPLLCYKSFKQIILILITHCLVSIIIPVFCGDKKRQFNEIKPLPDAAELDGIRTQACRMPAQGSSCRMANQPGEETRPGSGWLPGKLHSPRCCGVGSRRRACNFSLSPGHRLCGFIAQPAIFTSLLGPSLRSGSQRVLLPHCFQGWEGVSVPPRGEAGPSPHCAAVSLCSHQLSRALWLQSSICSARGWPLCPGIFPLSWQPLPILSVLTPLPPIPSLLMLSFCLLLSFSPVSCFPAA